MTREHIGAVSLLRLEWLNDHTKKKKMVDKDLQAGRVLFAEESGGGWQLYPWHPEFPGPGIEAKP